MDISTRVGYVICTPLPMIFRFGLAECEEPKKEENVTFFFLFL